MMRLAVLLCVLHAPLLCRAQAAPSDGPPQDAPPAQALPPPPEAPMEAAPPPPPEAPVQAAPVAPPGPPGPPPGPPVYAQPGTFGSIGMVGSVGIVSPAQRAAGLSTYRTGRALYGVGTAVGLVGSGMVLSGVFVAPLYDESLGVSLVYGGTGISTACWVLSTVGLGLQHNGLDLAGAPVNRGLYGVGTAFGILGLIGVGLGYFFGATSYFSTPEDALAAKLTTSFGGTALMALGGLFYFIDSQRMARVYKRISTF